MKKLACFFTLSLAAAWGQTVESIPFRAVLSPGNEVPAVALDASGVGTVWLHVVRDSSGKIISGSADFLASYRFPEGITLTGMHVHRGAAGSNGPVVIDSTLGRIEDTTGTTGLNLQGQILPENAAAISAATDMIADPSAFYLNIHTTVNPGGAIRGQLQRAQQRVFIGLMNPPNEVPAIAGKDATAVGTFSVLYTTGPNLIFTSASVTFDVNYTGFAGEGSFTGLHIHRGPAGVNGPVTVDSGMQGGANATPIPASGSGNLSFTREIPLGNANALDTLYGIFSDPASYYINVHTTTFPGGLARAQMQATDRMTYSQALSPANEVPAITGLNASAPAQFTTWSVRDGAGVIQAASVLFDVNYRFPGATTFTGLHIHNGKAGENGPVTVDSRITAANNVVSASGFGNIFRQATISTAAGLATLNALLTNPENGYMNLHTTVNPGGAVRDQVGMAVTSLPRIDAVMSAVSDPTFTSPLGRGGLFNVYGANLARVASNVPIGPGANAPGQWNGTRVVIGNALAPIIGVSPSVITAQIPFEGGVASNTGVYVITPNGTSNTAIVPSITGGAPATFLSGFTDASRNIALAYRMADMTFVTPANGVSVGDNVLVYATALGQTTPALGTGLAAGANNMAAPPVVTLGGRAAQVVSAQATPGMVGIYQVIFRVPTGVSSGAQVLAVTLADLPTNLVVLPVR